MPLLKKIGQISSPKSGHTVEEVAVPEALFGVPDPSDVGGGDDLDEPGGRERVKAVVGHDVRYVRLVVGVELKVFKE